MKLLLLTFLQFWFLTFFNQIFCNSIRENPHSIELPRRFIRNNGGDTTVASLTEAAKRPGRYKTHHAGSRQTNVMEAADRILMNLILCNKNKTDGCLIKDPDLVIPNTLVTCLFLAVKADTSAFLVRPKTPIRPFDSPCVLALALISVGQPLLTSLLSKNHMPQVFWILNKGLVHQNSKTEFLWSSL